MRLVIQRVSKAKVTVDKKTVGEIKKGLFVLVGVKKGDTSKNAQYLVEKLSKLRIMADPQGKMNLSLGEVCGSVLLEVLEII